MSCNYYRGKCLFLNGKEDGCIGCPIKKAYNKGVRDTKKDYERPTVEPFGSDYVGAERAKTTQIGDILVKAYKSGLLAVCGGMFDENDVNECYTALMIAFKMLKTNPLTLNDEYMADTKKDYTRSHGEFCPECPVRKIARDMQESDKG